MRKGIAQQVWFIILAVSLILAGCSSQLTPTISQQSTPPPSTQLPPEITQTVAAIQLTSTKEYLSQDPEVLGYHAVLMVERATDLILQYSEKVQAKEIDWNDSATRNTFIEAFPIAVDTFNQTTPPNYMAHPWKNVYKVLQEYTQAYTALRQGTPLTGGDVVNLRIARQLLTNYEEIAQANLAQRGLGAEFLTAKQAEVEGHFQEAYGDDPLPTLQP